jgi:hypothetical protein
LCAPGNRPRELSRAECSIVFDFGTSTQNLWVPNCLLRRQAGDGEVKRCAEAADPQFFPGSGSFQVPLGGVRQTEAGEIAETAPSH